MFLLNLTITEVITLKKFNFSLERILDYRKQVLELEKNNLQFEIKKENDLRAEIEKHLHSIETQHKLLSQKMAQGTNMQEISKHKFQIEALRKELEQCKYRLKLQIVAVEKQRQVVVEANRATSILEKLREKKLTIHNYEMSKLEEATIQEFINGRANISEAKPTT